MGTEPTVEQLIRDAHLVLDTCGISMGGSRVTRLVREYKQKVEPNGFTFFDFLANQVQLDGERQHGALLDDLRRLLTYSDPTGNQAVGFGKGDRADTSRRPARRLAS